VEWKSSEFPEIQARGTIESDGSFSLTTYEKNDGAIAGDHQCVVVQMVMTEDVANHVGSLYGVVNPIHNAYSTSGLTATIKADAANEITLIVQPLEWIDADVSDDHEHDEPQTN
jgi:hypothetical protein